MLHRGTILGCCPLLLRSANGAVLFPTSEGSPVWTDVANKQNPLQEVLQCGSFPLRVQGLCINTETLNLHCEGGDAVMLLMIQH